ncbi:hypothetical protein KKF91_05945 [Myxococcota bacterium]|nr:hypothetical protein [Myxococcota bacterium]MBU1430093.1 hypothetical protein [Myxococcota bacterium]MBU1899538.1 hypothetical protein [Myxococcota bacterium]
MHPVVTVVLILVGVLIALAAWIYSRFTIAQPDEWLLRMRRGAVIDAGIGVRVWRKPGDLAVRFSSTVQRIGFAVEALSAEKLTLQLEGFLFWSVSAEEGAAFRAFRLLGLADLERPPKGLKHPKHLLTGPQHKALQQMIIASVQREASAFKLQDLILDQGRFLTRLRARLEADMGGMGARVDQLQLLRARPTSEALLRDLCAEEDAKIREQAERIRLETQDRVSRARLELEQKLELEQQRRRAEAKEEAQRLEGQEAQRQHALDLERAGQAHALQQSKMAMSRAQALYEEGSRLAQAEAAQARLELTLAQELATLRRRAEAERDQGLSLLEVEVSKPEALRRAELQHKVAEKMAEAMQIRDGRWISIGGGSPLADLGEALSAMMARVAKPEDED